MRNIAIFDSDTTRSAAICDVCNSGGMRARSYDCLKLLEPALAAEEFHAVLIIWTDDHVGSIETIRWLRGPDGTQIPIIVITDGHGEINVIEALNAGADDFVTMPLRPRELICRIRSSLRRAKVEMPVYQIGRFKLDRKTLVVSDGEKQIEMTQKEFQLALVLLRNLDKAISRAQIFEDVWQRTTHVPTRTLDTHISRVRRKLDLRPDHGYVLAPVYNFGYRLQRVHPNGQSVGPPMQHERAEDQVVAA